MQSEIQDLKSIFKLYFDEGGKPVEATTGETLVYQSKQSYSYDFVQIKDILDDIGALPKAVKSTGLLMAKVWMRRQEKKLKPQDVISLKQEIFRL